MHTPLPELTRVALDSIGRALQDLRRPTGRVTEASPYGERTYETFVTDTEDELLLVTEDLVGAAFVVAQTYMKATSKRSAWSVERRKIDHISNYWKHRDEWDSTWTKTGKNRETIDAVMDMGALPPVKPGQLMELATAALGARFTTDSLWSKLR